MVGGWKRSWRSRRDPCRGFTLVELLVGIAIIALLIGIALPALSRARAASYQARESAAGQQLTAGYLVYANDHRGDLMPGYLRAAWTDPAFDPQHQFKVWDTDTTADEDERMIGTTIKRYPWRLAPYIGFSLDTLIVDTRLNAEYRALRDGKNDLDSMQRGFAQSPSFGLNTTYVGGDSKRGAFYPPGLRRWGQYYVTRLDQVRAPASLLVFATARGMHAIDTIDRVVPGHHRIEAPWHASVAINGQMPMFIRWSAPPGPFKPSHSPGTYGYLDFRHGALCLTATFDGHLEGLRLEDMDDMRRWSNQAQAPDWRPP